jgi:hypothetical protein
MGNLRGKLNQVFCCISLKKKTFSREVGRDGRVPIPQDLFYPLADFPDHR